MMAKKAAANAITSEPKFPYTPAPHSLRRFLKQVPDKPKPLKVTHQLLRSWGLASNNDRYVIGILKKLNFLDQSGVPTQNYEAFMFKETGPSTMGTEIKRVCGPLFQASHKPHQDSQDALKRLFNVHSGGSEDTISRQIQTFKTLCEFASFEPISTASQLTPNGQVTPASSGPVGSQSQGVCGAPTIHIDLHIHLPQNRTARDYEAIIQDIARYIYNQEISGNGQ
jgi:hypothetical protein